VAAALRRVRGVESVHVDRTHDEAVVVREKGKADGDELVGAVERAGYQASVIPVRRCVLVVPDMTCNGCPEKVETVLNRVDGVRAVRMQERGAQVYYDRRRVNEATLVRVVRRAGFHPRTDE
jgi:copper chaperone CopZ